MNSNKLSNKETSEKSNKIINNNSTKLSLEFIKKSIDNLYLKRNIYKEIVQKESLMNKLNKNIDNFFNGINTNNNSKNHKQNCILIKHYYKFINHINYCCNLFFNEESQFSKYKIINLEHNIDKNYFPAFSIILLKKFINSDKHSLIQNHFKLLLSIPIFHKNS